MSRSVVITVAPTGGTSTSAQSEHLPLQPDEIAQDVAQCAREGAALAALHARRPDGEATCDPAIYRRINELVRARCAVIVNNSTGGGTGGDLLTTRPDGRREIDFRQRVGAVGAGADMCTLGVQTASLRILGEDILMETSWEQCLELATRMRDAGIKPEWECYSHADLCLVKKLLAAGADSPPYNLNLVFGTDSVFLGALPYRPAYLVGMVAELPGDTNFTVTAMGRDHLQATTQGLLLGGHLRTGLEDALYYSRGIRATNAALVRRAARLVEELGMQVATPAEARSILGVPDKSDVAGRPRTGAQG